MAKKNTAKKPKVGEVISSKDNPFVGLRLKYRYKGKNYNNETIIKSDTIEFDPPGALDPDYGEPMDYGYILGGLITDGYEINPKAGGWHHLYASLVMLQKLDELGLFDEAKKEMKITDKTIKKEKAK